MPCPGNSSMPRPFTHRFLPREGWVRMSKKRMAAMTVLLRTCLTGLSPCACAIFVRHSLPPRGRGGPEPSWVPTGRPLVTEATGWLPGQQTAAGVIAWPGKGRGGGRGAHPVPGTSMLHRGWDGTKMAL